MARKHEPATGTPVAEVPEKPGAHETIHADETLRASEAKYRSLFESIDAGYCVIEVVFDGDAAVDYVFLEANPAFVAQTGLSDAIGKSMRAMVPEHETFWYEIYGRIARTGKAERFEHRADALDRWYSVYAFRVGTPEEHRVAVLFEDVKGRKLAELALRDTQERQEFLLKLSDAVRPIAEPKAAKAAALRILGAQIGVTRAQYYDVDPGGEFLESEGGYADGAPPVTGRFRIDSLGTVMKEYLDAGRTFATADVSTDPRVGKTEVAAYDALGIHAFVVVPLVKEGRLAAVLALHQDTPREWTRAEIALAEATAERTWDAIERSRAEAALRASEERYRSLFDNIDEGFCILEIVRDGNGGVADLCFREVNRAFERQGGFAGALGKRVSELMPNLEAHWSEAFTRAIETGEPARVENFLADSGRWYAVQFVRIGGAGSRFLAAVFQDVTERRSIERTSNRLAAIVESSDDAIISKDLDGVIQTWNAGAERMFGYTAEEVIGKPVTILMPPDRLHEEPMILARLRRGERIDHHETVRRRKDGSLLDVSLTISPIRDRQGKVVAASKIARDVSERRRMEAAMAEGGERQRLLLKLSDTIRDQPDERTIGTIAARMLAQHLYADRYCIIHLSREKDRAKLGAEYRRPGLPSIFGESGEVRLSDFPVSLKRLETESLVVKDVAAETEITEAEKARIGALKGMGAMIAAPLRLGRKNVWALVVGSGTPRDWSPEEVRLVEDVAERTWTAVERARVEEALQENQTRLQQANRAKDEFIAMLSHELRNPLAPIATTLELMKLRAPDVFVRERDIIEAQVRYLTGLVDDLLDVARIARGKIELKSEPVEIAEIVAAAVETTQPMMEEHRQSLHTRVEDGLMVSGDQRRLVQVLVNLLGNAAKYSPPEHAIDLEAIGRGEQVILRVCDRGRGISPQLLPRIFDLFTQDPQSIDRAGGGLGLGLAIVRNLVHMHGGSVKAESAGVGKGSVFTVRLPLLERRGAHGAADRDRGTASEQTVEAADRSAKTKVLIVDDYALAAESLSMLLKEMGYHTHVVNDGAAALKAIDEFEPDVALVDIGLPVMDGYEVARTVRSTPERRTLPLVAITGYGQASDHARVMDAGFDEHLVKPLNAGKIGELIEKLTAQA